MAKPSVLKAALERHQGRDRTREYKLDKQKKSEKAAEEKRKKKSPQEIKGAISDAALEAGVAAILGGQDVEGEDDDDDEDMEGWEDATSEEDSDDEENGKPAYDLGRLDESDSDSEIDDDEEDAEASAPGKIKGPKSILKRPSSSTESTSAKKEADPDNEDDEEEEEEDDIPLSDIDEEADGADDIIPYQRLTINNTAALTKALTSIALPTTSMPFSEHLTVSTPAPVDIPDINDDLNRELALYSQSMSAVLLSLIHI